MVIDSHEHMMLPTEMQLKMMDAAGVDQTILRIIQSFNWQQ